MTSAYLHRWIDLTAGFALFGEFIAVMDAAALVLLGPYGPVYGSNQTLAGLTWPPVLWAAGIFLAMLLLREVLSHIPGGEPETPEPDHRPLGAIARTLYEITEGSSAFFGLAVCALLIVGPGALNLIPHWAPFYVAATACGLSMAVFVLASLRPRMGEDDEETPSQLGER